MKRIVLVALALAVTGAGCAEQIDAALNPKTQPVRETTSPPSSAAPTTPLEPVIVTDGVTVTEDTIYVGVLADLSGPFSGNVIDLIDAQLAFWTDLNELGGIADRRVEVLVADTGYDLDRHQASYADLVDQVVMFTHSTGSPHTAAIADDLRRDDRVAIPVGWYSGWSDPALGSHILEIGGNYCLEAVNAISYLVENHAGTEHAPTLAIATDAGDYGQDSAAGARHVASELGIEVVYDGEAALAFGADAGPVAAAIAASGADYTWLATDPITTADVVSKALNAGYQGSWSGASPSFSPRLLDTALGEYLSQAWLLSVFFAPLGADVEGMDAAYRVLQESFPDRYPSDAFVGGYLQFSLAAQVLARAADLGDMTPAGVVAAVADLGSADFGGLSPANSYAGSLDDTAARATGLYRPGKAQFDHNGGLGARLADGARSPFEPVRAFEVSDVAAALDLAHPCYVLGS